MIWKEMKTPRRAELLNSRLFNSLLLPRSLTSPLSLSACRLSGLLLGRDLQLYGLSEGTQTTLLTLWKQHVQKPVELRVALTLKWGHSEGSHSGIMACWFSARIQILPKNSQQVLVQGTNFSVAKLWVCTCCSPSLDKASRMLRQAVARSAMDCHSSSVESVVSERTVRGANATFIQNKGTYSLKNPQDLKNRWFACFKEHFYINSI